MEETEIATILFWTGWAFVAAFVALNFGIERIWFPRPHRTTAGNARPLPPLVGPARRGHIIMGTIEAIVFIVGVVMVCIGVSIFGTRGYGSF